MVVRIRNPTLRSRIFVIIIDYNDRASRSTSSSRLAPPGLARRARRLAPLQPVWMGSAAEIAQLSALIPHRTQPLHSFGSEQRSDSRESQSFLPARPRSGKGQGSASPGTRVQFRMDPPQSCPNVVSLQIGRGVTPRPSDPLSPGAASTSSTGVSSRAFGLAVAYVSCHWRESRLGR